MLGEAARLAASNVIWTARNHIYKLHHLIETPEFEKAVKAVLSHDIVWTSGMGKAFQISSKFAGSLASNGIRSASIHPGDALHGTLGVIRDKDLLVVFSNSSKTTEIIKMIDKLKCEIICITGNPRGKITKKATIVLNYDKVKEACPLGLTPTTSTTMMLVLSDAIAMAAQATKGLTYAQYAVFHHEGYLGQIARQKEKDHGS